MSNVELTLRKVTFISFAVALVGIVAKLVLWNQGLSYRVWISWVVCSLIIVFLISFIAYINIRVRQKGEHVYNLQVLAITAIPFFVLAFMTITYMKYLPHEKVVEEGNRRKIVVTNSFGTHEYDYINIFVRTNAND